MKAETCNTCKQPFKRAHHWHRVYRHFLWFHWSYRVHHNCHHPEMGPSKVHRLPGELPSVGIAQGSTPTCLHLSEVADYDNPIKTIAVS